MNVKNAMLQLHQKPIAYYPVYRDITGSTTAAILLSQLLYWYSACGGRKFYKSDGEIIEETRLTEKELRNAKKSLSETSFALITLEGLPRRTFYDFDLSDLFGQLGAASAAQKAAQGAPKGRDSRRQKGGAITENTQENTTKNTTDIDAANAAPIQNDQPISPQKKRKKVAAKKEKTETPPHLYYLLWEVWAGRHERLHGETPGKDGKYFKAIESLVKKFEVKIREKGNDATQEVVVESFEIFLDQLAAKGDQWYLDNFTPDIFNSKFDNIINLIKRKHNEERKRTDKYAEALASFAPGEAA